ncbi:DUF551 domain-containing protein [Escherichia coli]|nr:DUF551 domain-containing protein [Escherichia coli]EFC4817019.1 DUF551 domain-containing protein [Escherichia coli]EFH4304884.1 DUF551 domain-containing protein [Escherichia coli]EIK6957913.1 DUF551 domain-containing protein [Escherichia coli]EIP9454181.1 DUF551 domain-containing protein [Escherichia coli]
MTTFTKEQLIEIIKRNITVMDRYPDLVTAQMDLEVYKIALASLEAEPVAYIFKHPAGKLFWALTDESNKEQPDVIPVYADSPASVVPDEIDVNDVPRAVTYFKTHRDCYTDGWNACRAAMLQSGNFRENKNSSTNNFREIAETSTNYPVIPSEVLSAILKVAKIRADFDDFDGDRRGIGDCLDEAEQELIVTINKYASQLAVVPVGLDERAAFNAWNNDENLPIAGVGAKNAAWLAWQARAELGRSLAVNSPVIPDSWISCSERMPDKLIPVMVMYEDGEMWSAMWNGNRWDDGTEYPDPHSVTHWREMPAAPQQEVK